MGFLSKTHTVIFWKPISHIMNAVIINRVFPYIWKRVEVTPTPKLKDPQAFDDFRPMDLLYHISKVAEKVIQKPLREEVPQQPNHYGYTPDTGTTDAIEKFTMMLLPLFMIMMLSGSIF